MGCGSQVTFWLGQRTNLRPLGAWDKPQDHNELTYDPWALGTSHMIMRMNRRLVAHLARHVPGVRGIRDRSPDLVVLQADTMAVLREDLEEADVLRDKPLLGCGS